MLDVDLYQKKLAIMRKNREKVPLEVLKTKYAEPYAKLKREIEEMTLQLLQETVLAGIKILPDDLEVFASQINETIRQSGILKQIGKTFDYDEILDLALELKFIVMTQYTKMIEGKEKYECYTDTGEHKTI